MLLNSSRNLLLALSISMLALQGCGLFKNASDRKVRSATASQEATALPTVLEVLAYAPAPGRTGQWWCSAHFGGNLGGDWKCLSVTGGSCANDAPLNQTVTCQKYERVFNVEAYSPAPGRTGQWWCTAHFGGNLGGNWDCLAATRGGLSLSCGSDLPLGTNVKCGEFLPTTPAAPDGLRLPKPTHPIDIGYYYSDGRYGNHNATVFEHTNLYIPSGWNSAATWGNPDPVLDLRRLMRAGLQEASDAGKSIYLMMNNEADWEELIGVARDFWPRVKYIELYHESDAGAAATEAKFGRLKSLLSARGLPKTPKLGVLEAGSGEAAPSIEFVGIEAYINAPGDPNTAVNITRMNSTIDMKKARVRAGRDILIVMMSYDRNGDWKNIDALKDLQEPVYLKAYDDARVKGILMFSYARPGGALSHPAMYAKTKEIGERIMNPTLPGGTPPVSAPTPGGPSARIGDIPQTFVTGRWNAPFANGWFPKLSPDGRYVVAGAGDIRVVDLTTGQVKFSRIGEIYGNVWMRPGVFSYFDYSSNPNLPQRMEASITSFAPIDTGDGAITMANDFVTDSNGNWVAVLAVRPPRITANGKVLTAGTGGACGIDGTTVTCASDWDNSAVRLFKNGTFVRDFAPRSLILP